MDSIFFQIKIPKINLWWHFSHPLYFSLSLLTLCTVKSFTNCSLVVEKDDGNPTSILSDFWNQKTRTCKDKGALQLAAQSCLMWLIWLKWISFAWVCKKEKTLNVIITDHQYLTRNRSLRRKCQLNGWISEWAQIRFFFNWYVHNEGTCGYWFRNMSILNLQESHNVRPIFWNLFFK